MGKRLLLCGVFCWLLPGKKSFNLERNAKPNHGMTWKLFLLPGNLWSVCCFFFLQNHCNCPTVEAGGQGFIQRPHGGAEISVQMPDPGITLKLHFIVICGWGLNFSNVIKFYLKEMFTLNVYYSREMLCLKLDESTFSYYGRRGGTSKTSNSIPIKM